MQSWTYSVKSKVDTKQSATSRHEMCLYMWAKSYFHRVAC